MFPRLEYLEWLQGRPEAALHDLATSALRGERPVGPRAMPEPLADLAAPPAGVTLQTQLAAAYDVQPDRVLVTAGATHANFLAAAAAIDEAETESPRVLVERPAYEPLHRTPDALGAAVDRFERGDGYRLDPDRVSEALREETCLATLTNRHNPSGRLTRPDVLAEVADAVAARDARLLVDEAHASYVLEPVEGGGPFGGPTVAGRDGVVVTGTLSKFPGLGEVGLGWLIADEAFVGRARRIGNHLPSVAETSVALGGRALYGADALADRSRALLRENAARLAAFVSDRDDLSGHLPEACSFAFLEPVGVDADALADAAWEAGVLIVPGRFFGDAGRVRLSLGRAPADAEASLRALDRVLESVA